MDCPRVRGRGLYVLRRVVILTVFYICHRIKFAMLEASVTHDHTGDMD